MSRPFRIPRPSQQIACVARSAFDAVPHTRAVPEETAVALVYGGSTEAVMMATPADLEDFAIGFSITEGVVDDPEQIAELANEFSNLSAVKESSTDVRRVTAIRALLKDRLAIFVGVDDAILEGISAGACGWVAGLADALPRESVDLFDHGIAGRTPEAFELYKWFLPLLRLDTVPKFVQLIKQVQQELGVGSARVRAPRFEVVGEELECTRKLVREAMKNRPSQASSALQIR